jgi:hypothetical protein
MIKGVEADTATNVAYNVCLRPTKDSDASHTRTMNPPRRLASCLALFAFLPLCVAQTSVPSIDSYSAGILRDLDNVGPQSVDEWMRQHPGEILDTRERFQPGESELEGQWCARFTVDVDLANGASVRRIALFYPPLAGWNPTLPPLPTETGQALVRHSCRLQKILYEFHGVADPQQVAGAMASHINKTLLKRTCEHLLTDERSLWEPIHCFFDSSREGRMANYVLAVIDPEAWKDLQTNTRPDMSKGMPAILLAWALDTQENGSPALENLDPQAEQPWLAVRAAALANQPLGPTLAMLSLLHPAPGRPPLACNSELVPALRNWLGLAATSGPRQHAAALVLADRVLADRLSDCVELSGRGIPYMAPGPADPDWKAYDSLMQSLKHLDVGTATNRDALYYNGNLLDKVAAMDPGGVADELGRIATIDTPCNWANSVRWPDRVISVGESILSDFPKDGFTPSVHLILAEAYAYVLANREYFANGPEEEIQLRAKAIAHYRAYYALSKNTHARALGWQEIWNLNAGGEPRLMLQVCNGEL